MTDDVQAVAEAQSGLAAFSQWIDTAEPNVGRDPEAALWGRVAKVSEEAGEAIAALIGLTGQNPRKGVTHTADDLIGELLDVAVTALAAVEHVTDNQGRSLPLLVEKVGKVCARAGITPEPLRARDSGDTVTVPRDVFVHQRMLAHEVGTHNYRVRCSLCDAADAALGQEGEQ